MLSGFDVFNQFFISERRISMFASMFHDLPPENFHNGCSETVTYVFIVCSLFALLDPILSAHSLPAARTMHASDKEVKDPCFYLQFLCVH